MKYKYVVGIYFGFGLVDLFSLLLVFFIAPEWFSTLMVPNILLLAGVMIWQTFTLDSAESVENYIFYPTVILLLQPFLLLIMLVALFNTDVSYAIVPIRDRIVFIVFIEYFMSQFVFDVYLSKLLRRGVD